MKKFKLWAGLLAIFASGFIIGFFVAGAQAKHSFERIFAGGPMVARDVIVKRLTRELALNETQRERVDEIVCRTQTRLFKIRKTHMPEVKELIDGSITEMKQWLDPEQCKKLDDHFERVRHRWWNWKEPPPGKDPQNGCGPK